MQISFHVHGTVQGVGYRRFVLKEAQALDLAGWVRNEADGSVSGMAEGAETALAAFRARLTEGPAFAGVERVDWSGTDMRSSLPHRFEIRR